MGELKKLPLQEIEESPVALRAVNEETEVFQELVDSIRSKGVINPISVRKNVDGPGYILIDGLHRYTASKRAELEEIPCNVLDMDDVEALEVQVIANIQKVDTKPVEYAKQLKRILSANPMMLMSELASKINKSTSWISERFNLLKFSDDLQALVNDGEICLSNAYVLVKLPEEERPNFADRAMTLPPGEFMPLVEDRCKEIRKANREGKTNEPETYRPVPTCRKLTEIKEELEETKVGEQIISDEGIKKPIDAWEAAIKWVMRVDADSVKEGEAKFEAHKKALAEAKERRAAERAKKKAETAASKAAKLQEEADKVASESDTTIA